MITKELEEFINQYIDLIDNNQFFDLFENARHLLSNNTRAELINMLHEAEIPFLSYMSKINGNLFYSSHITSIELPDSIRYIGAHSFANSSLHAIKINDGCETIDTSAFIRCVFLRDVSLPNSLHSIGRGAFANCPNLENVEYRGTIHEWESIAKGEMWFSKADKSNITIECIDGPIEVSNSGV